jgi:hypothetical protein
MLLSSSDLNIATKMQVNTHAYKNILIETRKFSHTVFSISRSSPHIYLNLTYLTFNLINKLCINIHLYDS